MATDWNKIGAIGIDTAAEAMFAPAALGVTAMTGQSLGAHATGEQTSQTKAAGNVFGKQSAGDMENQMQQKAQADLIRAEQIRKELEAQDRPTMSAAVDRQKQVTGLAQRYAQEGMPEAQRQLAQDNIARSQAQALSGASSIGTGLRSLGTTQATTAQAYRGLAAQDAQMANENRTQYLNTLGTLGGLEGQAEGYNTLLPYEQKVTEMQALLGSSQQNQFANSQFGYQQGQANQQLAMDTLGMGLQAIPAL